jgi:hypothetical protein
MKDIRTMNRSELDEVREMITAREQALDDSVVVSLELDRESLLESGVKYSEQITTGYAEGLTPDGRTALLPCTHVRYIVRLVDAQAHGWA